MAMVMMEPLSHSSTFFPMMIAKELAALAADMKRFGQRFAIITCDGARGWGDPG
jgi:hypothetical protein